MSFLLKVIITGGVSLVSCLIIMPLIIKLAYAKGWVVHPREDRWHKKPIALMGGIGIFIAFTLAVFCTGFLSINWMIYGAAATMFIIGLVDDIWEIRPVFKLLAQIFCAFALIYNGYDFGGGMLGWAGIPLTFLWVIGITNAINLLDNMDGLAAGIAGIVAFISGTLGVLNNEYTLALLAFAVVGAVVGFLFYNFKPARIFMGDSGSLFLGFVLSFLSISVQGKLGSSSAVLMLLIPISLMAIPIMDTTLVTIKRLAAGRRIDQGGKDHTSHRLVALGLSERKAVLTLYLISGIWGILCLFMYKMQINNLLLCVLLLTIFSVVFSILLSKVNVYDDPIEKDAALKKSSGQNLENKLTVHFFLFHKKLLIGVCTDILLIYCSFLIASSATKVDVNNDYIVLGLFICVKISIFYITNLYYRLWRYMEIIEVAGYFIVISVSVIILALLLILKGKTDVYSPYFFMVDFLLTFIGVVSARLIYRWLNELINRNRHTLKKVVIYGAGDSGYLLIKELLQNSKHGLKPIGWIDDDKKKHNMFLHGYKIYGGSDDLLSICEKIKPDMVLISSHAIDKGYEDELRTKLAAQNIGVGRFSLTLNYDAAII